MTPLPPTPPVQPAFDYATCALLRMSVHESARAAEAVLGRRVTFAEAAQGLEDARARQQRADAAEERADTVAAFERSTLGEDVRTPTLYKLIRNARLQR